MEQLKEIDKIIEEKQRHLEALKKDIEWLKNQKIRLLYDKVCSEKVNQLHDINGANSLHTAS